MGKVTKNRGKSGYSTKFTVYTIPAPYDRIVAQLVGEDAHAHSHNSHESYRRQTYALKVLDEFAEELRHPGRDRTERFRSKVLTPILQRQLLGIHDAYTPSVRSAVANGGGEPTVADATECYLSHDPVSPSHIPLYRRHLLYLPEARWHLATIMDKRRCGDPDFYNKVRTNHDTIMMRIASEPYDGLTEDGIPLLTREEVEAIFDEELAIFFQAELALVVSVIPPHEPQPLTPHTQPAIVQETRDRLSGPKDAPPSQPPPNIAGSGNTKGKEREQ